MTRLLATRLERLFDVEGDHPGRILPMEGLRGFAVLLVFFAHFRTLSEPWVDPSSATAGILDGAWRIGHTGVDLFFVLSGYLIYGAVIRRPVGYTTFLRRRVQRIYPTFLTVFAVYVALSFSLTSQTKIPEGLGNGAVYLGANLLLLPGMLPIEPLITVAWSLSYELFYYLAIPLLVMVTGMRRWSSGRRVIAFSVLAAAILAGSLVAGSGRIRLVMFVAGILVYEFSRGRSGAGSGAGSGRGLEWAAVVLGLAAIGVSGILQGPPPAPGAELPVDVGADIMRITLLGAVFGLVCWTAFRAQHALRSILSWTPLRWLGNMSYSFYLIHGLSLQIVFLALGKVRPGSHASSALVWLMLPVALSFALVVSSVLFALVERPFSLTASAAAPPRPSVNPTIPTQAVLAVPTPDLAALVMPESVGVPAPIRPTPTRAMRRRVTRS